MGLVPDALSSRDTCSGCWVIPRDSYHRSVGGSADSSRSARPYTISTCPHLRSCDVTNSMSGVPMSASAALLGTTMASRGSRLRRRRYGKAVSWTDPLAVTWPPMSLT